jgi:hypothetical protein
LKPAIDFSSNQMGKMLFTKIRFPADNNSFVVQVGQMLFSKSRSWNDDYMGPAMMAAPAIAMLLLITAVALLFLYAAMDCRHRRLLAYHSLPQTSGEPEVAAPQSLSQDEAFVIDDSAHASSSSDGTAHLILHALLTPLPPRQ